MDPHTKSQTHNSTSGDITACRGIMQLHLFIYYYIIFSYLFFIEPDLSGVRRPLHAIAIPFLRCAIRLGVCLLEAHDLIRLGAHGHLYSQLANGPGWKITSTLRVGHVCLSGRKICRFIATKWCKSLFACQNRCETALS